MKTKVKVTYPEHYFRDLKKNKKQRIYDCFSFFNEFDLLQLRLRELYNYVDYFVIAEATQTFSGKDKKLYLQEHRELFKKWKKKIIFITIDNLPRMNILDRFFVWAEKKLPRKSQMLLRRILANVIRNIGRYKGEEKQRNSIICALKNCNEEDIILGLDLDEIPRKEKLDEMKIKLSQFKFIKFEQPQFFYYFNGKVLEMLPEAGTLACKYKTLIQEFKGEMRCFRTVPYIWRKINPQLYSKKNIYIIKEGGWHFSHLGGIQKVIEKFEATAHSEFDKENIKEEGKIKEMLDEGKFPYLKYKVQYIKLDNSFPKTLLIDKKKFSQYLKNA